MKIISKLALLTSCIYLIGCAGGSGSDETTNDDRGNTQTEMPAASTPAQSGGNTNSGNVAVNPPHGEPGHDCNIAVGAPLDGSGSQGNMQIQNARQGQQQAQGQPAEGQKLNPPHGEPGHDCNVAVGAPLN